MARAAGREATGVEIKHLRQLADDRGSPVWGVDGDKLAALVAKVGFDIDLAADTLALKTWPAWLVELLDQ